MNKNKVRTSVGIGLVRAASLIALLGGSGCASADGYDYEFEETGSIQEPLQNASLVDVSGAIVEFRTNDGVCTGILIDEDALITAGHCRKQKSSHWPNIQVIYQENSTTWRCLTGVKSSGATVRGSHSTVVSQCPSKQAGFGSMFDYGTDKLSFPGDDPGETWTPYKHDFAVVKIWDNGFRWVGTDSNNYAALYTGAITTGGSVWAYGMGKTSPSGSPDYRVRRDTFNVAYSDTFVVGAFNNNAQPCKGDSGGPLGVFVSNPSRFAVFATLSQAGSSTEADSTGTCGISGGGTFWSNTVNRIWYIEAAIGKTCRSVNHSGVITKECWDL